jgi:hypothetical protein
VWAYLRTFPRRTSQVHIYVETKTGDGTTSKEEIIGTVWKGHHLMYPFQALRMKPNEFSRIELNTLIQVYYLEAGEIDRVWGGDGATPMSNLMLAISSIDRAYKMFPNGK